VAYSSGGILDLASIDPGLPIIFDNDDNIRFEFWEGFDDLPNAVDGVWNSGTITLQFEATAVPEPATMAVLGLGALAAMRRRRAK
jgi:PEP-CTERM motif